MGKLTGRLPRAGSRGQTHMGRLSRYALMDMLSRGCLSGMFCRACSRAGSHRQALAGGSHMHALTGMFSWSRSQVGSLGRASRQGLAGRLSRTGSRAGSLTAMLTGRFFTVCSRASSRGRLSRGQAHRQVLRRICSYGETHGQAVGGMLTGRVSQAGSETDFHSGRIRRRCLRAGPHDDAHEQASSQGDALRHVLTAMLSRTGSHKHRFTDGLTNRFSRT
jgi:hypothetical protein